MNWLCKVFGHKIKAGNTYEIYKSQYEPVPFAKMRTCQRCGYMPLSDVDNIYGDAYDLDLQAIEKMFLEQPGVIKVQVQFDTAGHKREIILEAFESNSTWFGHRTYCSNRSFYPGRLFIAITDCYLVRRLYIIDEEKLSYFIKVKESGKMFAPMYVWSRTEERIELQMNLLKEWLGLVTAQYLKSHFQQSPRTTECKKCSRSTEMTPLKETRSYVTIAHYTKLGDAQNLTAKILSELDGKIDVTERCEVTFTPITYGFGDLEYRKKEVLLCTNIQEKW